MSLCTWREAQVMLLEVPSQLLLWRHYRGMKQSLSNRSVAWMKGLRDTCSISYLFDYVWPQKRIPLRSPLLIFWIRQRLRQQLRCLSILPNSSLSYKHLSPLCLSQSYVSSTQQYLHTRSFDLFRTLVSTCLMPTGLKGRLILGLHSTSCFQLSRN